MFSNKLFYDTGDIPPGGTRARGVLSATEFCCNGELMSRFALPAPFCAVAGDER